MAANAVSRARAWHKAEITYLNLKQRLDDAPAGEAVALQRALAEAQDALMDLPAPSFPAVRRKLEILWELDMEKPDRDGAEKLLIIEDLTDLVEEAGMTLGIGRTFAAIS